MRRAWGEARETILAALLAAIWNDEAEGHLDEEKLNQLLSYKTARLRRVMRKILQGLEQSGWIKKDRTVYSITGAGVMQFVENVWRSGRTNLLQDTLSGIARFLRTERVARRNDEAEIGFNEDVPYLFLGRSNGRSRLPLVSLLTFARRVGELSGYKIYSKDERRRLILHPGPLVRQGLSGNIILRVNRLKRSWFPPSSQAQPTIITRGPWQAELMKRMPRRRNVMGNTARVSEGLADVSATPHLAQGPRS